MSKRPHIRIRQAIEILELLGFPPAQRNERSALCLLALLDLRPRRNWSQASNLLIGITPIMDWMRLHYKKAYKPNTRETVRRQTMHQFVQAGLAIYNPDDTARPVNSPRAVYQIQEDLLDVLRCYGSQEWSERLACYLSRRDTLVAKYAREREQQMVPVKLDEDREFSLSPGEHSELIRAVVQQFAPRFVPGSTPVYAGDTGEKWGYFDEKALSAISVSVDSHGKMPDLVLHCPHRGWLVLVECVTSHGPVDGKRHAELAELFASASCGIVYVTAFPSRSLMSRYLVEIAWETEVWVADHPSHLIHFDGERFLGPYDGE